MTPGEMTDKEKYFSLSGQYVRDMKEVKELLTLIRDDLKSRSDKIGTEEVINISSSIWLKINEYLER